MKASSLISLFVALVIFSSCKKSGMDSTSDRSKASISFQLSGTNSIGSSGRIEGGTLEWTSGYVNVVKARFDGEGDCSDKDHENEHGDFDEDGEHHHEYEDSIGHHHKEVEDSMISRKIDLFATPAFVDTLTATPCNYKNSKFEVVLGPKDSLAALELEGKFDSISVIFKINSFIELEGKIDTANLSGGNNYTAYTILHLSELSKYITSTDLINAQKDSNGVIVISSTSNTAIYYKILYHFHEMEEHHFH